MLRHRFLTCVSALIFSVLSWSANALTLGVDGQLFYSGGELRVQNLPASSGFANFTYLSTPLAGEQFLFVDNGNQLLTFTQSTLSASGIQIGDELLFLIRPNNGSTAFFTGPASRNPDNTHHANVADVGGGIFSVGFEDLFGGGDQDFDDAIFHVLGGALPDPGIRRAVPVPGTLGLIGLGLIALRVVRRRAA